MPLSAKVWVSEIHSQTRSLKKMKTYQKQGGLSLVIWGADMILNERLTEHHRMTELFSGPH
jgi:hypothetical protein